MYSLLWQVLEAVKENIVSWLIISVD